jgi:hypothetical protein
MNLYNDYDNLSTLRRELIEFYYRNINIYYLYKLLNARFVGLKICKRKVGVCYLCPERVLIGS